MLRRIKIWQKLAGIWLAVSIPLAVTTYFLLDEKSIKIEFASREIEGTQYLDASRDLLVALLRARALAVRERTGRTDVSHAGDSARTRSGVHRAMRRLLAIDSSLRSTMATSREDLAQRGRTESLPASIAERWERLAGLDAAEREARLVEMIAHLRTLIAHVGDSSKLILDPDLDTYYVMDAILLREPEIVVLIHEVDDRVLRIATNRSLTLDDRLAVAELAARLREHGEGLRADLDKAYAEVERFSRHDALETATNARLASAGERLDAFLRMVDTQVVRADAPPADSSAIHRAARAAIDGHVPLWAELVRHERTMLEIRRRGDESRRAVAIGAVVVTTLLTLLLSAVLVRSITGSIRKAADVAEAIRAGRIPEALDVGSNRDEAGMLLHSIDGMLSFLDLRTTMGTLQAAADQLTQAVGNIETQASGQGEAVTRQAAALQETQVTAHEIKQTSLLAAERAQEVLRMAERADDVSRAGELAVEQSLTGLAEIRAQVDGIAETIADLSRRTAQIGEITETVKDLADQSNMLALNAAVEAVRSGEHGRGFGVVAREIRALADQSIQATTRVRAILEDVATAARRASQGTEQGRQRMESGAQQARASGEHLRELATITRESSGWARQIAAAVNQQNAGIGQIFTAVTDQTTMMNETVQRLESLRSASATLRDVSKQVADVAERYRRMFAKG
ncbi:MAG: methyl-accepting chemotaxis protein [Deltaproteobacteria bacterium]|nr:methyl-accepting chemotaxis protein [Deltaproteobacteria bacterium]